MEIDSPAPHDGSRIDDATAGRVAPAPDSGNGAGAGTSATSRRAMRGAAWLAVRQAFVSVVTVGGVVALSLLLGPSDFALYGFATTAMLVAAAVGDLGLGASLIKDGPSDERLRGSLALQLAFWLPICAAGALLGAAVHAYDFSALTFFLLFSALFLLSLQTLPTALLERRMQFGSIAAIEVGQRCVFVAAAVALAAVAPAQWSIPLAAAIAAVVGVPAMALAARWRWLPRRAQDQRLFRGFSSDWWQSRVANQLNYATYPLLGGLLFSAHELGLIIWALAVSSVPALLAPMVGRVVLPALAPTHASEQLLVYRRLFKALLLVSLPLVAMLFVCADPLTRHVFGEEWLGGVALLRLESFTTVIGLALTPLAPLLFLSLPTARVKRIMIAWLACVVPLAIVIAPLASYLAISIAQIAIGVTVLVVFDRLLNRARGYGPLRDMVPGLAGLAMALAVGVPAIGLADGLAGVLAVAALTAFVQLAVTVALGGGVDPRLLIQRAEDAAASIGAGPNQEPGPAPGISPAVGP